jgi:hypothetical protein
MYMLMSIQQIDNIKKKIPNPLKMWQSSNKIFGNDINKTNCMYGESKCRLNLGNVCYLTVQYILLYHLLPEILKNKLCKIIIFTALMGVKLVVTLYEQNG